MKITCDLYEKITVIIFSLIIQCHFIVYVLYPDLTPETEIKTLSGLFKKIILYRQEPMLIGSWYRL